MSFTLYEASAPVFVSSLQNMRAWLDKTRSECLSTNIVNARLAEDMKPLRKPDYLQHLGMPNAL